MKREVFQKLLAVLDQELISQKIREEFETDLTQRYGFVPEEISEFLDNYNRMYAEFCSINEKKPTTLTAYYLDKEIFLLKSFIVNRARNLENPYKKSRKIANYEAHEDLFNYYERLRFEAKLKYLGAQSKPQDKFTFADIEAKAIRAAHIIKAEEDKTSYEEFIRILLINSEHLNLHSEVLRLIS